MGVTQSLTSEGTHMFAPSGAGPDWSSGWLGTQETGSFSLTTCCLWQGRRSRIFKFDLGIIPEIISVLKIWQYSGRHILFRIFVFLNLKTEQLFHGKITYHRISGFQYLDRSNPGDSITFYSLHLKNNKKQHWRMAPLAGGLLASCCHGQWWLTCSSLRPEGSTQSQSP